MRGVRVAGVRVQGAGGAGSCRGCGPLPPGPQDGSKVAGKFDQARRIAQYNMAAKIGENKRRVVAFSAFPRPPQIPRLPELSARVLSLPHPLVAVSPSFPANFPAGFPAGFLAAFRELLPVS